jgi:hypothetical protein
MHLMTIIRSVSLALVAALALAGAVVAVAWSAGSLWVPDDLEECTIAVLSGDATPDGRPILWKNRDAGYLDNEVVYFNDGIWKYVALVNAGDLANAWIGVNERGFAILNALSYNLPDTVAGGITNGQLMKTALQRCSTVLDFENYLRETNKTGRENPANLAVIDASGGAAVFEAAGRNFVRFDARNAPDGFLARTNFSLAGDTSYVNTWRYRRCRELVKKGLGEDGVDVAYLLQHVARDLHAWNLDPYPLPFRGTPPGYPGSYGYVETTETINRRTSVAGGAILGVRPGEDPLLSAFYPVVGPPVVTIPIPVWVAAGPTPPELNGQFTSPLCDLARSRALACYDDYTHSQLINTFKLVSGNNRYAGFLTRAERVERWIFPEAQKWLRRWREFGVNPVEVADVEAQLSARAFEHYRADVRPTSRPSYEITANPNPAKGPVQIRIVSDDEIPGDLTVLVFDPAGRRVATVREPSLLYRPAGRERILQWDTHNDRGFPVASGVYYLRPSWPTDTSPAASVAIVR